MREVHRLRSLEVRVAGHRPPGVPRGQLAENRHQRAGQFDRSVAALADVEGDVGRDLVVARAPGVELAAHRPGDLGDPPLDRHVDVLVVGREREAVLAELGGDLVERRVQGVELAVVEHPGEKQRPRVRLRLAHVLGPEALIELDRRVQPVKERVLGFAEARHRADLRVQPQAEARARSRTSSTAMASRGRPAAARRRRDRRPSARRTRARRRSRTAPARSRPRARGVPSAPRARRPTPGPRPGAARRQRILLAVQLVHHEGASAPEHPQPRSGGGCDRGRPEVAAPSRPRARARRTRRRPPRRRGGATSPWTSSAGPNRRQPDRRGGSPGRAAARRPPREGSPPAMRRDAAPGASARTGTRSGARRPEPVRDQPPQGELVGVPAAVVEDGQTTPRSSACSTSSRAAALDGASGLSTTTARPGVDRAPRQRDVRVVRGRHDDQVVLGGALPELVGGRPRRAPGYSPAARWRARVRGDDRRQPSPGVAATRGAWKTDPARPKPISAARPRSTPGRLSGSTGGAGAWRRRS